MKYLTRKHAAYFVIIASVVLLIFNLLNLDYDNLRLNSFFGIISNVLLVFAMGVMLHEMKKQAEEQ